MTGLAAALGSVCPKPEKVGSGGRRGKAWGSLLSDASASRTGSWAVTATGCAGTHEGAGEMTAREGLWLDRSCWPRSGLQLLFVRETVGRGDDHEPSKLDEGCNKLWPVFGFELSFY